MTELVLAYGSAWVLTYLLHSTLALGGVLVLAQRLGARHARYMESALRGALYGTIVSATVQTWMLATRDRVLVAPIATLSGDMRVSAEVIGSSNAPILIIIATTWLVVALVRLMSLYLVQHMAVARIAREPYADDELSPRSVAKVRAQGVTISTCAALDSPCVISAREICLPTRALCELTSDELHAVLAHELAHIERHDRRWLIAGEVVQRIFFFQPLVFRAASRLRVLAEWSCDDAAVRETGDALPLASALARISGWLVGRTSPALSVAVASSESVALRRVRRILDETPSAHARMSHVGLVALLVALAITPGISPAGALPRPVRIHAFDNAGPFSVDMDRGVVNAITIGRTRLTEFEQSGARVHARSLAGPLDLTLTSDGGFRWASRPFNR